MVFSLIIVWLFSCLLSSCNAVALAPTMTPESSARYDVPTPAITESVPGSTTTPTQILQRTATPAPTATPTVCLDQATPLTLPPRKTPLEVKFISDGNLWLWNEREGIAHQLTDTGGARNMSFSADGQVVVFERVERSYDQSGIQEHVELWAVNRDGSNVRRLVRESDLKAMGSHPRAETNEPRISHWLTATHTLVFNVFPLINGVGGGGEPYGQWSVDLDTGKMTRLPAAKPQSPSGIVSPDGRRMVIIANNSIGLANRDGTNRRDNLVTFPSIGLGHYAYAPLIWWSPDSKYVRTVISSSNPYEPDSTMTTWLIPADGSPARRLATFEGFGLDVHLSPNQQYIAFWRPTAHLSNYRELHLAKFDGSNRVLYDAGYTITFMGWAPDSVRFVYRHHLAQSDPTLLGHLCGGAVSLTDVPTDQIDWVDSRRFLFVVEKKQERGTSKPARELWLGSIGGTSILIGELNGEVPYATYQYNRESAAIGQEN